MIIITLPYLTLDLIFIAILCAIGVIDIKTQIINPILLLCLCAAAIIKMFMEFQQNNMQTIYVWNGLITAAITGIVFFIMYKVTKGLGLGDVKLMACVGAFYGVKGIFAVVFISMFLVSVTGIVMIIRNRKNLKLRLPFAPFIAVAAVIRQAVVLCGTI